MLERRHNVGEAGAVVGGMVGKEASGLGAAHVVVRGDHAFGDGQGGGW
ncbi:MAG: hypothetical protein HOZ81_01120 [Streptomyces sp.]|nr:hypothetical protein [Streptomyces sp.]